MPNLVVRTRVHVAFVILAYLGLRVETLERLGKSLPLQMLLNQLECQFFLQLQFRIENLVEIRVLHVDLRAALLVDHFVSELLQVREVVFVGLHGVFEGCLDLLGDVHQALVCLLFNQFLLLGGVFVFRLQLRQLLLLLLNLAFESLEFGIQVVKLRQNFIPLLQDFWFVLCDKINMQLRKHIGVGEQIIIA